MGAKFFLLEITFRFISGDFRAKKNFDFTNLKMLQFYVMLYCWKYKNTAWSGFRDQPPCRRPRSLNRDWSLYQDSSGTKQSFALQIDIQTPPLPSYPIEVTSPLHHSSVTKQNDKGINRLSLYWHDSKTCSFLSEAFGFIKSHEKKHDWKKNV